MNRSARFSMPLGYQLGLTIALAVFIPALLLGITSYNNATQIGLDNLELIVTESGSRRQEAIENDFRNALTVLSDFALSRSNQLLLTSTIIERNQIGISDNLFELESAVSESIRSEVIASGWASSVWLIEHDDPQPFSIETINDAQAPVSTFTTDINNQVLETSQALVVQDTSQALIVVAGNDRQKLFYLAPLFSGGSDDELEHIGTLVADLNLTALFIDNLTTFESFDTLSFVLWPNNQVLVPDDVVTVDLESEGVRRALATTATNVIAYEAQRGPEMAEVFGYFATLDLLNLSFKLISEVPTDVIPAQLTQSAASISFALLVGGAVFTVILGLLMYQIIIPPLLSLREAMRAVGRGDFEVSVQGAQRGDEIGGLANSFLEMRTQLQNFQRENNQRVENLARDVRVTQSIAQTITAERDLKLLMDTVVNQIVMNFPSIYHAQIFLVDEAGNNAVLQASTGEAGQNLLKRGHRLAVGSVSVIGQVTEQNQLVIARDTAQSDVHRSNEFLGETRAELALPLSIEGRVIGALDVQSRQNDSFDADQVQALRTLADQVTTAIENARLYEETARLLAGIERERETTTRQDWRQFALRQRSETLQSRSGNATDYDFSQLQATVQRSGQHAIADTTPYDTVPFAVPIVLRGVTLGVVTYEVRKSEFSYEKVLLAQELVNRLALSLDNSRLFRESQQAAERERLVNDISAQLTQHNNVHDIIETAIREVSSALRTSQVAVRFQLDDNTNGLKTTVAKNGYQPADEAI